MRKVVFPVVALLAALVFSSIAGAADGPVTLDGNIVCAKCTLKVDKLDHCQDVLLVKDAAGKETQYWLTDNAAAKEFGDVCTDVKPVTVTGTVEKKADHTWIAASKIEPRK